MPELSPTQKLDKAGVVVYNKLNKSRGIDENQLLDMVQTQTNYGSPDEYTNLTPLIWSGNDTLTLRFKRKVK
tara:strand:- start:419 stop:634 length:216 start_codon:yes stop_codon:yes gene_type:complete